MGILARSEHSTQEPQQQDKVLNEQRSVGDPGTNDDSRENLGNRHETQEQQCNEIENVLNALEERLGTGLYFLMKCRLVGGRCQRIVGIDQGRLRNSSRIP